MTANGMRSMERTRGTGNRKFNTEGERSDSISRGAGGSRGGITTAQWCSAEWRAREKEAGRCY